MNNERRKELIGLLGRLQRISSKMKNIDFSIIDSVLDGLNDVKDKEEVSLENLETSGSEGLGQTPNAENIRISIDNLEIAISNLEQLSNFDFDIVDELIANLEEIK